MRIGWLILAAVLCLPSGFGIAQVSVRLPLGGEHLPGRYMPARVIADLDATELRISGQGIVPIRIRLDAAGRVDRVAPLLVVGALGSTLHWTAGRQSGTLSLAEPLVVKRRPIVGVADSLLGHGLAGVLSQDGHAPFTRIVLPGIDPLPAPAAAWELLDAIVLDPPSLARLGPERIGQALASGIALYVLQNPPPDDTWPWQRRGEFWVLEPLMEGPASALMGQEAYLPAMGWHAGAAEGRRRAAAGLGILIALMMLGTLLALRPQVSFAVGLAVSVGLLAWGYFDHPIRQAAGAIAVRDRGLVQIDTWRYLAAPRHGGHAVEAPGWMKPVIERFGSVEEFALELHIASNDSIGLTMAMLPGRPMGVLERMVLPAVDPVEGGWEGGFSRLMPLARRLYLRPGDTPLTATSGESATEWSPIIIVRNP